MDGSPGGVRYREPYGANNNKCCSIPPMRNDGINTFSSSRFPTAIPWTVGPDPVHISPGAHSIKSFLVVFSPCDLAKVPLRVTAAVKTEN